MVYIRSRRPHHPALTFRSGEVRADEFEKGQDKDYWNLNPLGDDVYTISWSKPEYEEDSSDIYLRTYKYLSATPDGAVNVINRVFNNHYHPCCDKWKIESTRKGYVSIKSHYGYYLCADEDFQVTANRKHCELWEQWAILWDPVVLTTPPREVYIRSCRQALFRDDDGFPAFSGAVASHYGPATDNQKWKLICIDDDKIALRLASKYYEVNYNYLASSEDGDVRFSNFIHTHHNQLLSSCIWTIKKVEESSKVAVSLISAYGHYLWCDTASHFLSYGSVSAVPKSSNDESTDRLFLTDPSDINGDVSLERDDIVMKNYKSKYA